MMASAVTVKAEDAAAATSASSVPAPASSSPCAACKYLRRKCKPDCAFAPHFPPDQPNNFAYVHKVFGACNVSRMLNDLRDDQRGDCAKSLVYEARMRIEDPVNGCVRSIWCLESRLQQVYSRLTRARLELVKHQTAAAAAATHANTMIPDNVAVNMDAGGYGLTDNVAVNMDAGGYGLTDNVAVNMDAGGYGLVVDANANHHGGCGLVVDANANNHVACQRMGASVGQYHAASGAPENDCARNHLKLRNNDVRQHNVVDQIHDPVAMASMNRMNRPTPGLQLGSRLMGPRVAASVNKEVVAHGRNAV